MNETDETVARLLAFGRAALGNLQEADLNCELILSDVLACTRTDLLTWPDKIVLPGQAKRYQKYIARRKQGEPLDYILGYSVFFENTFSVDPNVLIPRSETEILVQQALDFLEKQPKDCLVLDLGTGSGVIGLSIAIAHSKSKVLASDFDESALAVARRNARNLQVNNIDFAKSHWYQSLSGNTVFNLIVSNPPYIACSDPHLKQGDLPFEPRSALVAGEDGLDDLKIIIQQAPAYLGRGGCLMVEHGFDQADSVQHLFLKAGFKQIQTVLDFSGHPRICLGCKV